MANEIVTRCFKTQEFSINSMMIGGEPWFIAKEIADILGYGDAEAMTRRLDDDEVQNRQIVGFGNRGVNLINESGLYSTIIGSNKPEAKRFKKWVTSEVLPSIRKTGQYVKPVERITEDDAIKMISSLQAYADLLHEQFERDVYTMDCKIKAKFRQLENRYGRNAHDELERGMADFALWEFEGKFVVAKPSDHYEYACVDMTHSRDRLDKELLAVITPNIRLIESAISSEKRITLKDKRVIQFKPVEKVPLWVSMRNERNRETV